MTVAEYHNTTIIRETKGRIPLLPFVEVKEAILGKSYELSVVFPTLEHSRELHRKWKKKSDPVNILSFPLDQDTGEIIMTLSVARREARKYERNYREHLLFLFIHGCLHLKGMTHGAKMEQQERVWYATFATTL
ncbi:rRNA maturation RNase YbeY [Patescibacteria group bacterium]|nr:rRNA maturation RNase YbeY [Patescibacteria group bacterium]